MRKRITSALLTLALFFALMFGMFAVDLAVPDKARSEVDSGTPDMIEILPGPIPRVIARLSSELGIPVIAGGLLEEKSDILAVLGAGALCVSTTDRRLWQL